MCLTDELSSIESILENLREESKDAQEELRENQNTLVGIYTALYSSPESLPVEWNDISSDLTKERREEFQRHVEEMQDLMEKKVKVVNAVIKDCVTLFKELRLYHEKDDVEERERASTSNSLNEEFQLTSFDRKVIQTYQTIICSNGTDSPSTVDPTMYKESSTCIGISDATVSTLKTRMKSLLEEKRHRKLTLHKMGTQIGHLWEKLKIPESVQRDFTESVKGLGMDTIQKGKNELDRLNLLKQEMIGKLISESRQEINALFDELNTGHEARLKFTPGLIADESLFTDELLEQHEEFVSSLKQKLEQMRPILNLIGRREEVLKERMEYEELQKDPERLQQRGAALTKQLMKEEKMSRRIKKDLPKYTQVLHKKCIEWEQTHSSQFMYKDKSYLELMEEQEEQWKEYKEKETQLKLEKRMKERNAAKENFQTGGSSFYKPLPGKKKVSTSFSMLSNEFDLCVSFIFSFIHLNILICISPFQAPSERKIGSNTSRSKSRTNMSGRTGMTSRPKSRPRPLSDAQSRDNSSSYRNPSRSRLIAPGKCVVCEKGFFGNMKYLTNYMHFSTPL